MRSATGGGFYMQQAKQGKAVTKRLRCPSRITLLDMHIPTAEPKRDTSPLRRYVSIVLGSMGLQRQSRQGPQ